MGWKRLGRIFKPEPKTSWMASHAAVPVAHSLGDGAAVRVYFTTRDGSNRSHVGFFEMNPAQPKRTLRVSREPVLEPGALGAFDEDGAMGSWILKRGKELWLYYQGWNRGVSVPFRNSIGLAVSRDGGESFQRFSAGPILDRNVHDPFFTGTPCVMSDRGGWRMWYLSGTAWIREGGTPKHWYRIVCASSPDGVAWLPEGRVCIDFQSSDEYAISRPCVIRDRGAYRMWFSFRGDRYRIGCAESPDGLGWTRRDSAAGLETAPRGWDSEMVEYPFVFDWGGSRYMLYNGNGYGRTGIGLALWTDDREPAAADEP